MREQTPEVCIAAVQQEQGAIEYVKDRELREELLARIKSADVPV